MNLKPLEFPFHVMVKPHGPVCNLACRYCFYLHKQDLLETASKWRMSDEVQEEFIRQYLQSQPDGHPVNFAWQGGEPTLMGIGFFKRAVELQNKYKREGQEVSNSFQTNAVLIDDEWGVFLKKHDFLIGISIDGPKSVHNYYRVNRQGEGSFDRIMQSVAALKKHGVRFNALTCVNNQSPANALEIYRFLREHFEFLQFIPIVEEKSFAKEAPFLPKSAKWQAYKNKKPHQIVNSWCVSPEGYGQFLCTIFDEWVRRDVGRTFVQLFDVTLARWAGHPPALCVFAPICGKAMVLEHDGQLYACDHFVYPEYKLGCIMETPITELLMQDRQRRFGEDKRDRLPKKCKTCMYLPLCNGGCPKNRIITSPDGECELNYLCEGYYSFFKHSEPHMKTMATLVMNRRPAAQIMEQLAREDFRNVKPNSSCPCGSGKKFKNCCMKKQ